MKHTHIFSLLTLLALLLSCDSNPHDATLSKDLPPIYPDYAEVTIPAGTAPLNFQVTGDDVDAVDVVVKGTNGDSIHTQGITTQFGISEWHALTKENKGDSLTVTVCVKHDGQWIQYRSFPIYVSEDELGEWGLTYRLIPPGYETYGNMGLYQRNLSTFEEIPIIENRNIAMGCVNCHTTNQTNPSNFTFHVRGDHGATVLGHHGKMEILSPRNETLGSGMVYPFWHPSGQYVAYSTNSTHQLFYQLEGKRVEVYDDFSDILVLDVSSHQLIRDSRIATEKYQENYPAFSPDGKYLYFCQAEKVDSIWSKYQDVQYNICRIAFDPATGSFNGETETVVDARDSGKSANQPRISYDGHYLLYTLCDYGCFPIWHKESDLWMMDLDSGEAFPLTTANSPDAESFHNWSLNSRWIVFTSRRNNGLYTQLFIAHISSDGSVAKPFLLPQSDPLEYDMENIYSFNTPDFASAPIKVKEEEIMEGIMSTGRIGTTLKTN